MTTLKHPRLPNVTVDVPESDVKRWEASGWVGPKAPEPEPVAVEDVEDDESTPRKRPSRKK